MSLKLHQKLGELISDKAKECAYKIHSYKKLILIIASSGVLMLCGSCSSINNNDESEKTNSESKPVVTMAPEQTDSPEVKKQTDVREYKESVYEAVDLMLDGGAQAEQCGNLMSKVWANSIFQTNDEETDPFTINTENGEFFDDFNDALSQLYNDEDFSEHIIEIMDNQDEVKSLMKNLNSPPEECKEMFDELKNLYSTYLAFTNLIIDCNESLDSFNEKFEKIDEEFMKYYHLMEIYVD